MFNKTDSVWKQFQSQLYGFILSRVHDEDIAADLLQDTFVKIHLNIASLHREGNVRAWIYRITRNVIADYYRRHQPMQEVPEEVAAASPEEDAVQGLADCVRPFVERMAEPYRSAMILSELEGVSQKEVAARQGISVSGAKSRVQRGRNKLKQMLTDCCALELDHHGGVIDYLPRQEGCRGC